MNYKRKGNYDEEVVLFCGVDRERLEVAEGKHTMYLRCPKYKKENRRNSEKVCMNRISYSDAQGVYSKIEELETSGKLVVGTKFRLLNIECTVFEINEYYIGVYVINRHKVKNKEN